MADPRTVASMTQRTRLEITGQENLYFDTGTGQSGRITSPTFAHVWTPFTYSYNYNLGGRADGVKVSSPQLTGASGSILVLGWLPVFVSAGKSLYLDRVSTYFWGSPSGQVEFTFYTTSSSTNTLVVQPSVSTHYFDNAPVVTADEGIAPILITTLRKKNEDPISIYGYTVNGVYSVR